MVNLLLGGGKNRLFTHYLGLCCVVLAFFVHPLTNGEIRYGKDILFIFMVSISIIVFNKIKQVFPVLILLISSFFIDIYSASSLYQLIMVIFGILLFSQVRNNEFNSETFGNYLVFIAVIQSLWFIANYWGHDPMDFINLISGISGTKYVYTANGLVKAEKVHQLVIGSLSQQTLSGVYFIFAIPYSFKKIWVFPLIIPGIILSNSTMVQLGCIFSFLCVINNRYSIYLLLIVVVAFILNLYVFKTEYLSGQERITAWRWGIENLKVFGNGLGKWSVNYPKITNQHFQQAHNEFLEFIYIYGIISLLPLYYLAIKIINNEDIKLKACVFGLLFNCLGNFPFHVSSLAIIGIILLANITKERKWHFQNQRQEKNY